jgi:hypothetical protein
MTMMGGPIDTRMSPTEVNNLATNHTHSWFERNVIYNVPQKYPGGGRRVYPGFLQHMGFVAMNPDRHQTSHWDFYLNLVRGDLDDAEGAPQVLRRIQRRAGPAGRVLPGHDQDRVPGPPAAAGTVGRRVRRPSCAWRPKTSHGCALFTVEGELDDISGPGQTRAAHKLCTQHPGGAPAAPDRAGRRATTASSADGAGVTHDLPAGARLHPRASHTGRGAPAQRRRLIHAAPGARPRARLRRRAARTARNAGRMKKTGGLLAQPTRP